MLRSFLAVSVLVVAGLRPAAAQVPAEPVSFVTLGEILGHEIGCEATDCVCLPCWQVQADTVTLTREVGINQPLATGVVPQWNVAEMNFGYQYGARISAARRISDRHQLEIGWLGVGTWEAGKSRTALASITGPGFTYVAGGTHRFAYDSNLHIGEVNVRQQRGRWQTIAGFRYIELSELFSANSGGTFAYAIDTNNFLYGFQLGVEGPLFQSSEHAFDIDGGVRAALYANRAATDVLADNFVVGTAADRDRAAAVSVEASLIATYQLTDNLAIRGGYQALWLSGIALAPSPLGAPSTGAVAAANTASADLLYHGGLVGLEGAY